jgi:DNA-binding CsgD family transcriptional regulator
MDLSERFWMSSLSDLKQGYHYDEGSSAYICLICGESFEEGQVYPLEKRFYEAHRFIQVHVGQTHGSMLSYLLALDKKATGLTDLQKELIQHFANGLADAEIVKRTGGGSSSTIRNHRFALKEKAKQAKLFLAVMELMDGGTAGGKQKFMPIHRTATQVDERYAITEEEYEAIITKYFPDGRGGKLTNFPRKEKRKIAILKHISAFFKQRHRYTEREVNEVLKRFFEEDYVTLRRYLIEYGFLDREGDGSAYWVKV